MGDNTAEEHPERPWWATFFAGDWPEILSSMKPPEATRDELAWIHNVLELRPGMRVLDAPCGNGRLGLGLAEFGCEVVGVDLQPALIREANRRAAELGAPFEGREGDMRDLPWFDEFDAAFSFWSSVGYFEDGGDREFFEAVWRTLKPGAPFLIDTQSVETMLPRFLEKDWFLAGGWTVLEERHFDCETSRIDGRWTFVREGETRHAEVSIRLYTCRELCDLLTDCGFGDFEAYDTATGEPFTVDASRLGLIGKRKG